MQNQWGTSSVYSTLLAIVIASEVGNQPYLVHRDLDPEHLFVSRREEKGTKLSLSSRW